MIEELQLFQRSTSSIWTDEYISKNLLSAHLDLNNYGASRSKATLDKTLNWIKKTIPEGSNVLDLGCGPGLYDVELASWGCYVTGIDFNSESIRYAEKEKNVPGKTKYEYGNYLEKDFNGKYESVLMIYCDFGALIPSEQTKVLKKIHSCLTEKGIFIFDIFRKGLLDSKKEKRNWYYSNGNDFWRKQPYLMLEEIKYYLDYKAVGTRNIVIDETTKKEEEYIMWDQYYDEETIGKLLGQNGFVINEIKLDLVGKNQFTSNDVMFIRAEKRK